MQIECKIKIHFLLIVFSSGKRVMWESETAASVREREHHSIGRFLGCTLTHLNLFRALEIEKGMMRSLEEGFTTAVQIYRWRHSWLGPVWCTCLTCVGIYRSVYRPFLLVGPPVTTVQACFNKLGTQGNRLRLLCMCPCTTEARVYFNEPGSR